MRDAAWAALARMLRCESTTPFGVPSEPEVNRITAAVVGLAGNPRAALAKSAEQFVLQADGGPQIVQPDDVHGTTDFLDHRCELGLLDEGPRRQHGAHLGRLAGRQDVGRARREVDHRRHLARRHDAEQRRARAVGIGQHDAERRLVGVERPEFLAKHGSGGEQLAVGERAGDGILDGKLLHAALASPPAMIFSSTVVSMSCVRKTRSDMTW